MKYIEEQVFRAPLVSKFWHLNQLFKSFANV